MSVERSLIKFISDNITEFVGRVYVATPELDMSKITLPFATVGTVTTSTEHAYIGDDKRAIITMLQIDVHAVDYESRETLVNKIANALETSTTTDEDGNTQKGINLLMVFEKLVTTDNLNYTSAQKKWFASPAPIVYKNKVIITTGFTFDLPNGIITFASALLPADEIRVTAKVGFVDFYVPTIVRFNPEPEQEQRLYSAAMTISTFIYERKTGQPLY